MLEKTLKEISENVKLSTFRSANPGLKKISRVKVVEIINKNNLFKDKLTVKGLNLFVKLLSFSNVSRNSNFRIKVSNKPIDLCMEHYEASIIVIWIYSNYLDFPHYIKWLNQESERQSISGTRHKILA